MAVCVFRIASIDSISVLYFSYLAHMDFSVLVDNLPTMRSSSDNCSLRNFGYLKFQMFKTYQRHLYWWLLAICHCISITRHIVYLRNALFFLMPIDGYMYTRHDSCDTHTIAFIFGSQIMYFLIFA